MKKAQIPLILKSLVFSLIDLEANSKKYDTKDEIVAVIGESPIDCENVEQVTLSENSYGREACDYLASLLEKQTPKLTKINFNDMFVGRKLQELPGSLEVLARAIKDKEISYLDLSDNAFGPVGIKSFDFLLSGVPSLKVIKVNNCGIGPVNKGVNCIGRRRNDR